MVWPRLDLLLYSAIVLLLLAQATSAGHRTLRVNNKPRPPPRPPSPPRPPPSPRPPPPSTACLVVKCPGTSKCQAPEPARVPICVCPGTQRLVPAPPLNETYVCTTAAGGAGADYVDRHNQARAAVQAPPLVWDEALAALAQQWATKLRNLYSCSPRFGDYGFYGQNVISAVSEKPQNGTAAVTSWISNGQFYKLALFNPKVNRASGCSTGRYSDCAPYVQTVWQYSRRVGCASALCAPTQVFVCDYDPPGLLTGLYTYTPCATVACSSPSVCDPFLGLPANCTASPCNSVTCPTNSVCALTSDTVPYCTCKKGFTMSNQTCITTPSNTSLPQTSVSVYTSEKFVGSPWTARPPIPPTKRLSCTNLPSTVTASGISSFKIRWSVDDAPKTLPPLSSAVACKAIVFWNQTGCVGSSATYTPTPGFPSAAEVTAQPLVKIARSIQCG